MEGESGGKDTKIHTSEEQGRLTKTKSPPQQRTVLPVPSDVSVNTSRSRDEPLNFKNEDLWTDPSPPQQRPVSPVPSDVSVNTSRSRDEPLNFKNEDLWTKTSPHQQRPVSPVPSDVSVNTSRSRDEPLNFKNEDVWTDPSPHQQRPVSPVPSDVSVNTSRSRDEPLNFKNEDLWTKPSPHQQRPVSPVPSDVSVNTSRSRDEPLNFKNEDVWTDPSPHQQRPVSPVPSDVSVNTSRSRDEPLNFKNEDLWTKPSPHQQRPVSPVPSDVSVNTSRSRDEPLNFKNEDVWTDPSPPQQQRPVSSGASVNSTSSTDDPLNFMNESTTEQSPPQQQRPVSSGASVNSTSSTDDPLNFMNESTTEQSNQQKSEVSSPLSAKTDTLDGEKEKEKIPGSRLQTYLKKRIQDQYEQEMDQKQSDTELYIIEGGKETVTKYEEICTSSRWKTTRTVLMKGVAGIGKTIQTRRFMVDWAKGTSNKNIELLFPIDFGELNSRDADQSLEELIHDFCEEDKKSGISDYNKQNITFILDGLDQLPLDFQNNRILTDVKKRASLDVLLTNLIKGNLLKSAHLWIICRSSTSDKIPPKYINKVTECREISERRLQAHLKETIQDQYEQEMVQKQSDTELYIIEGGKETVTKYEEIFKSTGQKTTRTVLMKGVAGIGKTIQTRRFMVDWAKGTSNKNIKLLFPINFGELNSRRDEDQSLEELIHHVFKESKKSRISDYNKQNITFILDGLDQLPLDFQNNTELIDVKQRASLDVLLTNLIKGNLLKSAHLWIICHSSTSDKIPPKYIDKMTECREIAERRLQAHLKETIQDQYEQEMVQKQSDTDFYIIEGGNETVTKYEGMFKSTGQKTTRTVLMKGVAGIGKTIQTRRFMVDWAKGTSNTEIKLLFSINFGELNSRKDEDQSLEELIHHLFEEAKKSRISDYNKQNITFILDGLDQLPLDFQNNPILTDVKQRASLDVLLTNLIKGNLLQSAHLWIICRSSTADKIPPDYIDKVTVYREKIPGRRLQAYLKKRIQDQCEQEMDQKQNDTELYIIEGGKETVTEYEGMFKSSWRKTTRTVLMKGVAGIGKTIQTRRFMVDWAKGKSNKNIDLLFSIDFGELNSRRDEDQSLEELIHHLFEEAKKSEISYYKKQNITFILDGLDQLPLDFQNNPILTDVKQRASLDVLLTNLIKGNLLQSAHLWIICRSFTADKIPPDYIDKVTECRESVKRRQKLSLNLKKRFTTEISQTEDTSHPNQKNTEHIIKESRSEEVMGQTKAKSATPISHIFKPGNDGPIRTVLTIGEAGIGKTFHAQKFIRDWARHKDETSTSWFTWLKEKAKTYTGQADKETELIFPLTFSQLNLIKENLSLLELLNHFFTETKEVVISNYEEFKVIFVFDGLDQCKLPLDFVNNNADLTDVREPASVDVLLTNLMKGKLLPSACLWITSQPSAAKLICSEFVDRVTEIREKPDLVSKRKLKHRLTEQFHRVSEGITKQANSALLNEIYTELYIIEGESGEVNSQHESRQVEAASFKPVREETPIKYHDIFKPAPGQNKRIRTVLTNGVAGIGKTIASQKYMLDWAQGTANQDIYFIFPLPFRELNLRKEEEHSLEGLIHQFFSNMKSSEITNYDKYQILFVLDGLDECRLDLNFTEGVICRDVRESTPVNILLTNLIQGNLLPEARLWITSRPAASNHIPPEHVDLVTEVRGFNDPQKEEYFMKRFNDKDLGNKIISHVKKSRSLYIMCHIPVFCWITATVLEDMLSTKREQDMPKTLTDMYIHFLVLQCKQGNTKYHDTDETHERAETDSYWNEENKKTIQSLGKLAFEELEKSNLVFMEEDLAARGIDITASAVYSGLFTQISREDNLDQRKMFCFVHLSIQEFLASVYVFLVFINKSENVLTEPASTTADKPGSDFYKSAVDKALDSDNGDWDLFLRFLLGLSLETNQKPLQGLMNEARHSSQTNKETIEYIKEKIRGNLKADKSISMFHCLNELNDHSLVKEIKTYIRSGSKAYEDFTPSQWSALTFVLLTSDEKLDVFDLKKYLKSEQVLLGMLPVVNVSRTALLSWCDLTETSCEGLASSVLRSSSSNLTELDLSSNDLLDSGIEQLSTGLKSLNCRLEILKLSGCQVTEKGCASLASALRLNPSHLKHLDLSYNHPGDSGVELLSDKAEMVRFDHGGERRLKPGMWKYGVDLTLDVNTASRKLVLSEDNRKVRRKRDVKEEVPYPDHPDRFNRTEVLCEEGLKDLCYWEVEWTGTVGIAVAYRGVKRKGWDKSCGLGCNDISWSLICSAKRSQTIYKVWHKTETCIYKMDSGPNPNKIALFLDWEGGTLDIYNVSSGKLSLIHTFCSKFTEPLYPGFWFKKGSVSLCEV